jgi:hypothetical protein
VNARAGSVRRSSRNPVDITEKSLLKLGIPAAALIVCTTLFGKVGYRIAFRQAPE